MWSNDAFLMHYGVEKQNNTNSEAQWNSCKLCMVQLLKMKFYALLRNYHSRNQNFKFQFNLSNCLDVQIVNLQIQRF